MNVSLCGEIFNICLVDLINPRLYFICRREESKSNHSKLKCTETLSVESVVTETTCHMLFL